MSKKINIMMVYLSSVYTGSNTDTTNFGWKLGEPTTGENHTKPYTEVYIRRVSP